MKSLIIILALILTTATFADDLVGKYYGTSAIWGWGSRGTCSVEIKHRKDGYLIKYVDKKNRGASDEFVTDDSLLAYSIYAKENKREIKVVIKTGAQAVGINLPVSKLYFDEDGTLDKMEHNKSVCRRLRVDLGETIKKALRR